MVCDDLFRQIERKRDTHIVCHKNTEKHFKKWKFLLFFFLFKRFEVLLSMMEIYNEQVRDLQTKSFPKGGLNVRQHPTLGYFYAENLRLVPVGNYADIEGYIFEGTANRTIAATNMNATSSRAHTVVTIYLDQFIKNDRRETKKSSVINLIDLAGRYFL